MNESFTLDYSIKGQLLRLASFNPVTGGVEDNTQQMLSLIAKAKQDQVDIILFPELAITGYPPDDLLLYNDFMTGVEENIARISKASKDILVVLGAPRRPQIDRKLLFNSLLAFYDNSLVQIYDKHALPNYGVFNERRFFTEGSNSRVIKHNQVTIGLSICEDLWDENISNKLLTDYRTADIILNASASPYELTKHSMRQKIIVNNSIKFGKPIAYCNLYGATDQLIFDGHCFVADPQVIKEITPLLEDDVPEAISALTLALKDYVQKNGFNEIVFGLSGGLDSALVMMLAIRALGKDNVHSAIMPSKYSSAETQSDAEMLAQAAQIDYHILPIEELRIAYENSLSSLFKDLTPDVTEENIQARIRGNLLMALSNKFHYMVIATGNKSELSVGYSTLYGDMSGGYSLIKDVLKTEAFRLTQWFADQEKTCNPQLAKYLQSIIDRPPSAELREDQQDTDSLPPYPVLDPIIIMYIEQHAGYQEIIEAGFEPQVVAKIIKMINRAEHKRQQASPGPKVRFNAYSSERRMPIINHFDFTS